MIWNGEKTMASESIKCIKEAETSAIEKKEDAAKKSAEIVAEAQRAADEAYRKGLADAAEKKEKMFADAKAKRLSDEQNNQEEIEAALTDLKVRAAVSMPDAAKAVMEALLS